MQIKKTIEKVPGGLMVVPLLLGAAVNTIDQMHLWPLEELARLAGISPTEEGHYEWLGIGGFAGGLVRASGVLTLIALFLVCVGSQMNFMVGGRALKKGLVITSVKLGVAVAIGYAVGAAFDPFGRVGSEDGAFLGLSMVAIIAALSNGNGGLYAALTGQYGNRSDVGALSVISLNDGPFFTLVALGLLGEAFPVIAFIGVLAPMLLGFILGNLDPAMRRFLAHGETLTIPFFAFALGTLMNLAAFFNGDAILGGLFLGLATVLITGPLAALVLRITGDRSTIAGVAEGSTAGNATQTPFYVAAAAGGMAALATDTLRMAQEEGVSQEKLAALAERAEYLAQRAELYNQMVPLATAQVSISTITTAVLCPLIVIVWDRWQRKRGIDGRLEPDQDEGGDQISPPPLSTD